MFALTAGTALADPTGWQVMDEPKSGLFQMSFNVGQPGVAYIFDCRANKVLVTETGVTELMDIQTGQKVSNIPSSALPPGASVMALFTDQVEPQMRPARAKPNSANGWDLTLELSKDDRAFRSLSSAKMISLMTTGWTGAVVIGPPDHNIISGFVNQCEKRG
jgi:hypothetical protein